MELRGLAFEIRHAFTAPELAAGSRHGRRLV